MSRSCLRPASLCALHGTLERACGNRLHRGEVDAITPLELLVAVDRNAPEAESESRRLTLEHGQSAGAEPAAGPLEEHDLDAATRRR